jgi:hypothetical protein
MKLKPKFTSNMTAILLKDDLVAPKGDYLLIDSTTEEIALLTADEAERFFWIEGSKQHKAAQKKITTPPAKLPGFSDVLKRTLALFDDSAVPVTSLFAAEKLGTTPASSAGNLSRLTKLGLISHITQKASTGQLIYLHSLTAAGKLRLKQIAAKPDS